jgi:hypothetical protein
MAFPLREYSGKREAAEGSLSERVSDYPISCTDGTSNDMGRKL